MTEISAAMEARLGRMENDIKEGFDRIEKMVRQQVQDIKTEQIKELKDKFDRLADDQRRLWDLVHAQGVRESQRTRLAGSAWHIVTALCSGGLVAAFVRFFSGGGAPPHP